MRPFGRFVRPRAERCRRPRFEGLAPASECCASGHGQRMISAGAYVSLHDGQVLQAHARERSATTPSVPTRPGARSCDTFESLYHGAACRSAEGEELPSEVDPIRASPRATRFGNLAAADRRFPIRDAGMVLTFYTGLADNAGGLVLIRAYRPQGGTTRAPGSMVAPPAPVGKRPIRTSKTHSSDLLSA